MSHTTSSTIGIALAAYRPNPADFVRQLESIQTQTYGDWFCVITFDSPLVELDRARELEPFRSDPRFLWSENKKRLGFVKNFERAVALALGEGAESIALSDQDDVWYPRKLEVLAKALEKTPPLSLVHSDMDIERSGELDRASGWVQAGRDVSRQTPLDLLIWNTATGASMLMDAALVRLYPTIPEGVRYHDHFYALAASLHGGVYPVPERLYAYRQHETNVIGAQAYQGLLGGRTLRELFQTRFDAVKNYDSFVALARFFSDKAPELSELASSRDLGAKLLWHGARHLGYKSFARESFALGCGKLIASVIGDERGAARR